MKRSLTLPFAALAIAGLLSTLAWAQPAAGARQRGERQRGERQRDAAQPALDRPGAGPGPNVNTDTPRGPRFEFGQQMQGVPGPQGPQGPFGPGAAAFRGGEDREDRAGKGFDDDLTPYWRNDRVREELKLTDDQTKKLEEGYVAARQKLIDLEAELARARFERQEAIRADTATPDFDKALQAIEREGKAQTEIRKLMVIQRALIWNTLTPEQREKGKELMIRAHRVRQADKERGARFEQMRDRFQNLPEREREEIKARMKERIERRGAPPAPGAPVPPSAPDGVK